jgi:NADH:ubiquinone oxidoreductase subunit F (NADH-binding)/NADH:ubiquinone oxidoreductase subunit E
MCLQCNNLIFCAKPVQHRNSSTWLSRHAFVMIVQELTRIQNQLGYLPREALTALAQRLALPLYRIQEVVSFFPHFRNSPPAEFEFHVCRDMACHLRGSQSVIDELNALAAGQSSEKAKVKVCPASCLGRCDRAPAVRAVHHVEHGEAVMQHDVKSWMQRAPSEIVAFASQALQGNTWNELPDDRDEPYAPDPQRSWRIDAYADKEIAQRYESIRRFIASGTSDAARDPERDRIIKALKTAGLLGMGGAGGRAFKKWSEVREAKGAKKYVVCNADESEPGTFKDRELLLRTPHLVLEGVILAGLLLNATRGYIYIRHEYEEQIDAMERAIRQAEAMGRCGENILNSGVSFAVEVFISPGGYICGEQTALIEAIEDKRAEPRNRPPELQTNGLWDMPTLLNNVETLAWVPAIVLRDEGQWYAKQGAGKSFTGARFFSISGDVARPGVYEVPIGITLRALIHEYAGGIRGGESLKAVALSGASGGFLPAMLPLSALPPAIKEVIPADKDTVDVLDLELDMALFRKWNLMLGAGIVVYAEGTDMIPQALACLEFYQRESCGKCVPCRIGSTKLVELATRLSRGEMQRDELQRMTQREGTISELAQVMRQTAICGLGTVAANPLTSLTTFFSDDVAQYLKN